MILLFGGTTEGRKAATVCEQAGQPFFYSTKGSLQQIELMHGIHISGAMDEESMASFCEEEQIRLIIDAAHPFALLLHNTIAEVSRRINIPVIRYERIYPERDPSLVWLDSYRSIIDYLFQKGFSRPLFLTGVNTLSRFKPFWEKVPGSKFRILNREESKGIAKKEGFPAGHLLYYQPDEEEQLIHQINPDVIITKESGESGGFREKTTAAHKAGIPVIVLTRPRLAPEFICINGENGLRKEIEKNLPGFFPLRTGFTTGASATAAAKAALTNLLSGKEPEEIAITFPNRESISLPIHHYYKEPDEITASVLKDAGDDPDVTNGLEIRVTIRFNDNKGTIRFLQGEGVGIVTLSGLGLPIGEPAINNTPREMIRRELTTLLSQYTAQVRVQELPGLDVIISVPGGEEIAQRTFNPKLGIRDGISIIGTSGIVRPFSSEAFIASIRKELEVAKALGCEQIVINSGAKSERLIKERYPELPPQAFIHYGNFIGETIRHAASVGFRKVTLGIMIGKAVKLAEGALDTHSKKVVMNKVFLIEIAKASGCSRKTLQQIEGITLARELWQIIPEQEEAFFDNLIKACYTYCTPLLPNGELQIILIPEPGK